jgi:hypothetical protein
VLASRAVAIDPAPRALVVLADGAQAAFAAGAVAGLARLGGQWDRAWGAGLGAHVALLAVLGEAADAERRWIHQAESGCPLLASRLASVRGRMTSDDGIAVLADAGSLAGWLDPAVLAGELAAEAGSCRARLVAAACSCNVAVTGLRQGSAKWVGLECIAPQDAFEIVQAAACFPGGWPAGTSEQGELLWGGVSAAVLAGLPDLAMCDVVCGFAVPGVERPALGRSLLELVQRRDEVAAAAAVQGWCAGQSGRRRLLAPNRSLWAAGGADPDAELGVEYPLPWERNAGLVRRLLELGRLSACQ